MIDLAPFDSPLFSDAYRRLLREAPGIAEPGSRYPAAAAPPLRERIVRCIGVGPRALYRHGSPVPETMTATMDTVVAE